MSLTNVMGQSDLIYLNAFNLIPEITRPRLKEIRRRFSDLKNAWERIKYGDCIELGIEPAAADRIERTKAAIDPEKEFQKLIKEEIELVTLNDGRYPALLKEIPDAPFCFYIKGSLETDAPSDALAIVGTRRASAYGKQAAEFFASSLARLGMTITSGLALGIDTEAHKGALAGGGKTVAVLGSGLDESSIYPPQNRRLSAEIIEKGGALISEYPYGAEPKPYHFPERNRIISGLSLGVLVIEAQEKSGALITANLALEQNREVFAVPGSIFSKNSAGANELIKKGAKLVTQIGDILEELHLEIKTQNLESKTARPLLPEEERQILEILTNDPQSIDKIIKMSKMSPSQVMSAITMLEMKGLIKNLGGNNYIKKLF